MKKYPDNSEIYKLKEERRREIENLPPIERLRIARRLQKIAGVSGRTIAKERDPNWSLASGRPKKKRA